MVAKNASSALILWPDRLKLDDDQLLAAFFKKKNAAN